jgi:hypothetical protein
VFGLAFPAIAEDREGDQGHQHEQAVPGGDCPAQAEQHHQQAGAQHDRAAAVDRARRAAQRIDQGRAAQDQQHIGDVGADHVADRDGGVAAQVGIHADQELGGRGAVGDDGKADQQGRHAQVRSQSDRAADQHFSPQQQ